MIAVAATAAAHIAAVSRGLGRDAVGHSSAPPQDRRGDPRDDETERPDRSEGQCRVGQGIVVEALQGLGPLRRRHDLLVSRTRGAGALDHAGCHVVPEARLDPEVDDWKVAA